MEKPTYEDVLEAREFIAAHLPPTPLVYSESLSHLLGCEYWLKCENFQPVGAFKVRGGVNLVGRLGEAEKGRGVIAASTGNHGQSLAYAGRLFGTRVLIYAPERNANPAKVEAMRRMGAEVRLSGRDFDEAREAVEKAAREEGYRYVHSANEKLLISGVGTMGLEICQALPDVEVLIAPVGGGSGICGLGLAAKHHNPELRLIGVQAQGAPACWHAWQARTLDVQMGMETAHEGLATRVPFEMTMRMMWELVDEFALVDDGQIDEAIRLLAAHGRLLAEGAGAASLAAARLLTDEVRGKKVVGIVSGGNLPLARYARILAAGS